MSSQPTFEDKIDEIKNAIDDLLSNNQIRTREKTLPYTGMLQVVEELLKCYDCNQYFTVDQIVKEVHSILKRLTTTTTTRNMED
jgi:hypothetical protein